MPRFSSLRIRLVLLVVVATLPGLIVLLFTGAVIRRQLVSGAPAEAARIARLIAEREQRFVDTTDGVLTAFARQPSVLARVQAGCESVARHITTARPLWVNLHAASPAGVVFCSAAPLARVVYLGDRPHFQDARARRRFSGGDYIVSRTTGRPAIGFSVPAIDDAGELQAIVTAAIDRGEIQRALDSVSLPAGATAWIADRNGVIFARSPRPPGDDGAPAEATPSEALRSLSGPVEERTDPDGVRRIHSLQPVVGPSGEGVFQVAVNIPTEAAYANLSRLLTLSAWGLAASGLIFVALAALMSEFLFVRGIQALVTTAGRISSGDLAARTGLGRTRDEVGQLATAFDDMAASVQSLTRQNRLVLDSVGEGIIGTDQTGHIVFATPAAARALGRTVDEMIGQDAHGLLHPRKASGAPSPRGDCVLHKSIRENLTQHVDDEVLWRADGSSFPVEFTSTPILDGSTAIGAVLAFRDVSERIALEEQLRQSQKMEALGQLAGGVAHDFNNLLTAILACGHFLQEDLAAEHPARADVDTIVASGERAAALTRQLLALGRRQRLQPRAIDLAEAVRGMEPMLRRVLGEAITFEVETRAAGPVFADPAQLELVVLNLVVNARDAMPNGGRLVIGVDELAEGEPARSAEVGLPSGPLAMLAVRDSGCGMSPEVQTRIFDPFFTTKGPGKGSGLGLPMVYGIVSQSGGAIRVRSVIGQGTEMRVFLPRRLDPAKATDSAPAPDVAGGSETVLLVEDDDIVRSLARRMLAGAGYTVLDAGSPSEALAVARSHPGAIGLLVSDVLLPEQNGWELSRLLLADRPKLRVLFMSGYAGDRLDGQPILPVGVPLVAKPFTSGELLGMVRGVLDAG